MSRVLVTGGAGAIGGAIVRRLLADPAYEVRVSDRRAAPQWMREGAELHEGDLRVAREARAAIDGCTHVIHLAGGDGDAYTEQEQAQKQEEEEEEEEVAKGVEDGVEEGAAADLRRTPYTLMETVIATCGAVIGAAVEPGAEVERFVYVSSSTVFEQATELPTSEAHLAACATPKSSYGFAVLAGEMYCRAAYEEHGLQYTICRPFDAYGPGIAMETRGSEGQTRTPTHVDDIAGGVIAAMGAPRGANEDFNIAAARELTVAEIARIVWETCGEDPGAFAWEPLPRSTIQVARSWPSVEKARRLLGWEAQIELEEGIAATVARIRARGSVGSGL